MRRSSSEKALLRRTPILSEELLAFEFGIKISVDDFRGSVLLKDPHFRVKLLYLVLLEQLIANWPLRVAVSKVNFLASVLGIALHQLFVDFPCERKKLSVDENAPKPFKEAPLLHIGFLLESLNLSEEVSCMFNQLLMSLHAIIVGSS